MGIRRATELLEGAEDNQIRLLEDALREVKNDYDTISVQLEERLAGLDLMAEDVGWSDLSGFSEEGPSLDQLHKRSKQIRNLMSLNPHIKQGALLRASRVWSDPIRYEGVPGLGKSAVGRGTSNVGKFVDDPRNQHYVFGSNARIERENCLYSDGAYFLLGDNATKLMHPIPLWEITADYRNPDNSGEIWAYQRSWLRWNNDTARSETVVRWYFTDLFTDHTVQSIRFNGELQPVDTSKTIIDGQVNTQAGWAYGFSDAGCVVEWARIYKEFMISGKIMTDAMARIWATTKAQSAGGGAAQGVKIAGTTGFGQTAVGGNELSPLATAGKAYDFDAGTALLAIVATGLEVSVIALSSNPGAAGSSYGAAQVLSLPERLATQRRRDWHAEYDQRILRWLGATRPRAAFPPLVDGAEQYRLLQAAQLAWASGLYGPEEAKINFEQALGEGFEIKPIPPDVLTPNTLKTVKAGQPPAAPKQAGGAGQGQANGSGGNNSNDTNRDAGQ